MKEKYKKFFLDMAVNVSSLTYCKKRKVGAIIVKNNNIISMGYNGTLPGADNDCEDEDGKTKPTVIHAEENAILHLVRNGGTGIEGAAMFCSCSPCINCARLIVNSGIKEFYYVHEYKSSSGLRFLQENGVKVEKGWR